MILARASFRGHEIALSPGDVVLLRGPNGSGKTSLLRALAGLPPAVAPERIERPARAGFAPQDARDALVGLTVAGEFRLRGRAVPAGLAPLGVRASTQLASGEARRVALAAAEGAAVLLLDEPAEGLDAAGRDALHALVVRAAKQGAVVVADHGQGLDALATRVVDLGPAASEPLPPVPRAEGAPVLVAEPASARGVALPALALGPGLHALRGANGSGKSTLLARLAGLLPGAGVRIAGAPPEPGANVRLLLPHAADLLTRERVDQEMNGQIFFSDLFVEPRLHTRHPLTLSGGEAQRVALAKVLGTPAPCYLLDEPEAHLDAAGRARLARALARRAAEGACILVATHDDALAALAQSEVRL